MFLKELRLRNYRNYDQLDLSFRSNLIIFVGQNAQGKTNILESIFLCCTGRSHRTPKDKELIKWQQEGAYIKTRVDKTFGESMVEIHLRQNEKKRILINAMAALRLGELMGHINSVMFSPEDLRLVKEGPSERRRFMDMELSQIQPRYFYYLQQYNRILNHRNNLLKEIRKKSSLRKTLPVWNHQLAEAGCYITAQRHLFNLSLQEIARRIHWDISHHQEELNLSYRSSIPIKTGGLDEIRENFMKALEEKEQEDIDKGSTSRGCHRDDIIVAINGTDVRNFGSQGQQRTTALSLKLSELELMYRETGDYPILLLDDVMSELDPSRQRMLLHYIGKVQTFITATDLSQLPDIGEMDQEIYHIARGSVGNYGLNRK